MRWPFEDQVAPHRENLVANTDNVGEKLLEEISFGATDRGGEKIIIDKDYVRERVEDLAKDADLSRFIL